MAADVVSLPLTRRGTARVVEHKLTDSHPSARPRLLAELVVATAAALAVAVLLPLSAGPLAAVVVGPLWLLALGVAGAYARPARSPHLGAARVLLGAGGLLLAMAFAAAAAGRVLDPVAAFVLVPGLAAGSLGVRWGLRRWETTSVGSHAAGARALVVGCPEPVTSVTARLQAEPGLGLVVADTLALDAPAGLVSREALDAALAAAVERQQIDAVVFALGDGLDARTVRSAAWKLEEHPVRVLLAPGISEVMAHRVTVHSGGSALLLEVEPPAYAGFRRVVKSTVERAVAAVGLIALAPLLVTVAAAIRLESEGPALFRQTRMGRRGETFTCLKFRTMVVGAENAVTDLAADNENDGHMFKLRRDPRVTRLGAVLRRLSLDELLQLVNVVRGEMSLIGPRPPLVHEVQEYDEPEWRRLNVRPGMTGLWQVSGRSDLGWDQTVQLDLRYVENWSLRLDLSILARTVGAVVRGTGAY